jgi:hypothetical protein
VEIENSYEQLNDEYDRIWKKGRELLIPINIKVWYEAVQLTPLSSDSPWYPEASINDNLGGYTPLPPKRTIELRCGHRHNTPEQAQRCASKVPDGKVFFVRGKSLYINCQICDVFYSGNNKGIVTYQAVPERDV